MPLSRIISALSDSALVANMERLTRTLDEWAAEKFDVSGPEFARERTILSAMRSEWRTRSGEVMA